jgi:putative tryptophan/tyrosine transport system substrate-binding protein
MRRRDFIRMAAGSAIAWPTGMAGQPAMPMIAFIRDGSAEGNARNASGFRKGLNEGGFVEDQNITVEYHWLEGKYDRLPALLADVIRRGAAVIVTPGNVPTHAAKAATSSVPIVFGVGENPVEIGLVPSFSKPGGNATGINFLTSEMVPKRLRLLHDMVPKATRIAVLVNPGNPSVTNSVVRELQEAASNMGLQTQVLNATSISEIDAAFATVARDRLDALFVAPDALFVSRRVQLVTLTARDKVPAIYSTREPVVAGGLMSYGVDLTEMFRLMGVYSASILKGSRPGDLPVLQATKFEFIINVTTARALGLTVPAGLVSIADEVIE